MLKNTLLITNTISNSSTNVKTNAADIICIGLHTRNAFH